MSEVSKKIAQLQQSAMAKLYSYLEVAHRHNCEEYVIELGEKSRPFGTKSLDHFPLVANSYYYIKLLTSANACRKGQS
jgi:hypothetical protein